MRKRGCRKHRACEVGLFLLAEHEGVCSTRFPSEEPSIAVERGWLRLVGGLSSPSPNASPESTCSAWMDFPASHQGYREKTRWEIRASMGEGDIRWAWRWGEACKSGCPAWLEWRGCCEPRPCCPQTLRDYQEGANLSSLFLPALFIASDLSTLASSLLRR